MAYDTDNRLFRLHTHLDSESPMLLLRFEGEEGLSRLFHFDLDLATPEPVLSEREWLGEQVRLVADTGHDKRSWCGYISHFGLADQNDRQFQQDGTLTYYRMRVVPWLWFMLHNEDSRIFQNLSIPDIVEKIFAEFRYSDYELKLKRSYEPLEYCTQYRESVYAFICRLLERAGIYWYFRHEDDKTVLVLADDSTIYTQDDRVHGFEDGSLTLLDSHVHEQDLQHSVVAFAREEALRPSHVAINDYHFERPGMDLYLGMYGPPGMDNHAKHERYLHPGRYTKRDDAEGIAHLLIQIEEARQRTYTCKSHVLRMSPGRSFHLDDRGELERAHRSGHYLITRVRHQGSNNLDGEQGDYANECALIPKNVPYRHPQETPHPRIAGPQTAIVTGPDGEEIHTDQYGRVKVNFFWDRRNHRNEKSSCWVRVAQMWAGRQWGTFFLPRVGHEVVVEFLEGDPDQPIVTGSMYNGDNMPPYALPQHATRSTIKTLSSKGGEGFNELRFEDKKGEEQVFLHAQKDLDQRVRSNVRTWTGKAAHHIVGHDRIEKVGHDQSLRVEHDRITAVGGDDSQETQGNRITVVHGDEHHRVDTHLLIEAGVMLTLKAGPSTITLSGAGITIDGPMVQINCGGAASPPPSLSAPLPAPEPAKADDDQPGSHHVGPPRWVLER